MKQSKFIKQCGPYEVHSISQDMQGVRLEIYPAFPQYDLTSNEQLRKDIDPSWQKESKWAIHRLAKGEGGGPGIFTAIALAEEFEEWLNQFYTEEEVTTWKATLRVALKKVRDKAQRQFEKAMGKATNLIQ